jgi:hypothetical protein
MITTFVQSKQKPLHPLQWTLNDLQFSEISHGVTDQPQQVRFFSLQHSQAPLVAVVNQILCFAREQFVKNANQREQIGQQWNDVRCRRIPAYWISGFRKRDDETTTSRSLGIFWPRTAFDSSEK